MQLANKHWNKTRHEKQYAESEMIESQVYKEFIECYDSYKPLLSLNEVAYRELCDEWEEVTFGKAS